MLYPLMPQTEMQGEDDFFCKARRTKMLTATCLDYFVDNNALRRLESPCYKCQQGQDNRESFSKS
jgi:hypothetical protein